MVLGVLQAHTIALRRNSRPRLAQVGGSGIETLGHARAGLRSCITVLNDSIRRQVHDRCAVGTEGGHAATEVNSLKFASEVKFDEVGERDSVRNRKGHSVESAVVLHRTGHREAAHG